MYSILGFKWLLTAVATVAVLLAFALLAVLEPATLAERLGIFWRSAAVTVAATGALGSWQGFVCLVWRWFARWLGPCPVGVWEGTLYSNFSRQQKLREAAQGRSAEGSQDLDRILEEVDLLPVACRMEISANLYGARAVMTMPAAGPGKRSHTLAMRVLRAEDGRVRLAYVYEQQQEEALDTDERSHLGGALLTLNEDGTALRGRYWTDRRWDVALNTAGRLELTRI